MHTGAAWFIGPVEQAGEPGLDGRNGKTGETARTGMPGPTGSRGVTGEPGSDGRYFLCFTLPYSASWNFLFDLVFIICCQFFQRRFTWSTGC